MKNEIERGKLNAAGTANESYQENYQIKDQYQKNYETERSISN